ncbi:hypothetical protein R1sor_010929 [Riccia sorocarpa]|uniref:Uncharacterized protein n=1 Tax=Riccia sorocarpa TaxID=122646 RepID=A0ABD3HZF7_9MARC
MDHKRGHGSLDHSNEQHFTRVKRHKDYSYHQPTASAANSSHNALRRSRLQAEEKSSKRVEVASVEQLRAIAEKSAKTVNNLGPQNGHAGGEKSVEENAYEVFLHILLAELSAEKIAAGPKWPLCLTDKRIQKHCHICPFDRRFRGWEALLIHAAKYQKDNTRQHRGYYRALRQAILQSTEEQLPLPEIPQGPTSPLPSKKRASGCRWASSPVKRMSDDEEEAEGEGEEDTPSSPQKKKPKDGDKGHQTRNPHLKEVLALYGGTGRCSHQKKPPEVREDQITISGLIRNRWLGAEIKNYAAQAKTEEAACKAPASSASASLCTANGGKAMQLGRPSSPKDHQQRHLAEAEHEKLQSEELKLRKPLEEHRLIFDEDQFDDKVQSLVNKWRGRFQNAMVPRVHAASLKLDAYGKEPLPKLDPKKDEKFKNEVDNLNSSCQVQVRRQISVLQSELQKDKLVWLQEVEAVREQFQSLADSVYAEQIERDGATLRVAKHLDKITECSNARINDKSKFFLARKIQCMHNVRRMRQEQEMHSMVDLWREEQRVFEKECQKAKEEKGKLRDLHDKIHTRAKESKKKQCPICHEKWEQNVPDLNFHRQAWRKLEMTSNPNFYVRNGHCSQLGREME